LQDQLESCSAAAGIQVAEIKFAQRSLELPGCVFIERSAGATLTVGVGGGASRDQFLQIFELELHPPGGHPHHAGAVRTDCEHECAANVVSRPRRCVERKT